jgi:hypothetical protein
MVNKLECYNSTPGQGSIKVSDKVDPYKNK